PGGPASPAQRWRATSGTAGDDGVAATGRPQSDGTMPGDATCSRGAASTGTAGRLAAVEPGAPSGLTNNFAVWTNRRSAMKIVGYSDRFSVAPGEDIRFMVSCELPTYQAAIVRLIHGDTNPAGPGFKEQAVQTPVAGSYRGSTQPLHHGSYVRVPESPAFNQIQSFTLACWLYPTTPQAGVAGLLGTWSCAES